MKRATLLAGILLLSLCGCGGPKYYPVEGTVQWADGKPAVELAGGAIHFDATDGTRSATGPIGADARYRLITEPPNDGVPAGEYIVTLSPPLQSNPDRPTRSPLHASYQRLDRSKLTAQVRETRNNIPIQLERTR